MKPFVCFMGLDGSGKSTGIEYARKTLAERGVRVRVVRAAYVVKIMSVFTKLGKKILMKGNSDPFSGDYKEYLEKMRKKANSGGFYYKVFSAMTTLEFKMQIFFNITLRRLFGQTLLVDRYIYDNAVTYAANMGLGEDYMKKTIEGKWKRAPKPAKIIYIKTPIDVCLSRKDDIPDPLYLEIRKPLYEKISDMYGATVISGDDGLERMQNEIMEAIDSVLDVKK
ncbi:MAG: hypothetical protein E7578_03900 [Ruminococcaceae bacterium]|nr:hypothetical protein [Oscillospiraceae bacterium]